MTRHSGILLQPEIRVLGRQCAAFHACGLAGLMMAFLLALGLASHEGLSRVVVAGIGCVACGAFLTLAMATKVVSGEERLVYYRQEIAIVAAEALFLRVLGQPVLPYLDITVLGVGMFLVFGRVGCLMSGCCHGRPWKWGVRYGHTHARNGFASHLVGVRLFPVQAAESIAVFVIAIVGVLLILANRPPGAAFAWYTVAYGVSRFCLEFLRGDPDRPYWRGFSESQWISMFLTGGVVCAELYGGLPFSAWHPGVLLGLVFCMVAIALRRRADHGLGFQLMHPRHVREVAHAMRMELGPSAEVRSTSQGIRISSSKIQTADACLLHVAFSASVQRITGKTAAKFTNLIGNLTPELGSPKLVQGRQGVFHVLFPPPAVRELRSK